MRNLLLGLIALIILNFAYTSATERKEKEKASLHPYELTLSGVLREVEDVYNSMPPIRVRVQADTVTITVGATERYYYRYNETRFVDVEQYLRPQDFLGNDYYYNPYLNYGGTMLLRKDIDGTVYERTISNFKRQDIDVEYLEMDSLAIYSSYHLSQVANSLVIPLLKDTINKKEMIVARSMKEALENPDKVWRLSLRNTRTTQLLPEISRLKNLRVLDISGSWIEEIPDEIEQCTQLKAIIANASRLQRIPATIGNLPKLRVANFGYCRLTSVPPALGNATSLWSLHLSKNQLTSLPEELGQLKNLTFFSAEGNQLEEFPTAVLSLETVGNLWLHNNPFSAIPTEIQVLPRLHHFLITEDRIDNIDTIRQLLPNVRVIDEG